MQALLYLDLATKKASESLGGAAFRFPTHTFGEDATLGLRLSQRTNGKSVEVSRVVQGLTASIGHVDARPEGGSFAIKVGLVGDASVVGTNVTTALPHSASAKQVADALNALALVGTTYGAATAEEKGGSYLVTFSGETEAVEISAGSNSLFPVSFLRVMASEFDGEFVHDLRLIQAPVVSTSSSARVVPPAPVITTLQDGSSDNGTLLPEIQKLYISPAFRGTYQFRRGYVKSVVLSTDDDVTDIAAALLPLADEDGFFEVSNYVDDTALIVFAGDMVGTNHDPLEVEVFDAPEGDLVFRLNLSTPELAALLRKKDSVTLPFEITAEIEDVNDSETVDRVKLLSTEITIKRELHFEELATSASIDWLRPPLPKNYQPFSTGQISNGQLHYATTVGDAVATVFTIDHNLDSPRVDVIVHDNSSAGSPLVYGTDYTYTRASDNSLDVTFTTPPTAAAYLVTVLGLSQTSYFDAHTHLVSEVDGLQAIIDDLGARVLTLEALSGNSRLSTSTTDDTGTAASWTLPKLFEVFPSRVTPAPLAEGQALSDLDATALGRARGLLAAVHAASVSVLPSTVPTPSIALKGTVYRHDGADGFLLPGGQGHRSAKLDNGDFATCDGRLWYPVARYGDHAAAVTFSTDFATDATQLDAPANEYEAGTLVTIATDDTPPAPLIAGTTYEVLTRSTDALTLTTVGGDTAITLTDDGTGPHTLSKVEESSYYPTGFERDLFTIHVNGKQLRLKKKFALRFAIEAAVLNSNTNASWTVAVEVGTKTRDATPGTTGKNIAGITWRGTPILSQEIVVTPLATAHRFGIDITRSLIDSVDTLTTTRLLYGAQEGGVVSPSSSDFALRARLIRFDTENNESDPKGATAIRGFIATGGASGEGFAIIA